MKGIFSPPGGLRAQRLASLFLIAALIAVSLARLTPTRAQAGKTLVVGIQGDIRSLDPYGSQLEVWVVIRNQIFDTLITYNPSTGEFGPRLATEWKYTDPTTLELTLREGVKFHSGAAFSADDVKFSFDRAMGAETGGEWVGRFRNVESVTVNSPTSVTVKLKEPDGSLTYHLAGFSILSAADGDKVATEPNGTGPFKYNIWEQGNQFIIDRNPDSWRKAEGNVDQIVFRVISNQESRVASLLAGDVAFLYNVPLKDVPRLQEEQSITVSVTSPSDGYWIAYMNIRKPPLDNVKVRQAILTAFDRQTFGDAFTAGNSRPSNTPLAPENPYYNAEVDKLYAFDMAAAAKLLEEAGYPGGKGLKFEIIYPSGFGDMKSGSEMIQAAMTELGAEVTVTELELANWSNRLIKTFEFDMSWDIRSNGLADPAVPFAEATFYTPSEANVNGFKPGALPRYEELLKQGNAEPDLAKRKEIYNEIQKIWAENLPGLVIARRGLAYAYSKTLSGVVVPLQNSRLDFSLISVS